MASGCAHGVEQALEKLRDGLCGWPTDMLVKRRACPLKIQFNGTGFSNFRGLIEPGSGIDIA